MTRSVEIPEEAVEEAAKAIYECEVRPGDWVWSKARTEERLNRGRVALLAALQYLAPAVPKQAELAEWLRDIFSTDADPEGTTWEVAAEELQALLALYPAAPAVPQPADERPLRAALEKYFSNGGPDTPIRTTWHDGVEHWEAPAEDIRELIEGSAVPQPVDREALEQLAAEWRQKRRRGRAIPEPGAR